MEVAEQRTQEPTPGRALGAQGPHASQPGGLPLGTVLVPGVGAYRREPQGNPNPVSYHPGLL